MSSILNELKLKPIGFAIVKINNLKRISIWAITDEVRASEHVEILGFAQTLHRAELIRDKILFNSAIAESEAILEKGIDIGKR